MAAATVRRRFGRQRQSGPASWPREPTRYLTSSREGCQRWRECARSRRELRGQNVDALDRRRFSEQLAGFLSKRRGHLARKVGCAACLVGKRVEDSKRGRSKPN